MKSIYKTKLIEHFLSAKTSDIVDGLNWYEVAYNDCKKALGAKPVPLKRFIAIVTVLSPQKRWEKNIDEALLFLEQGHDAVIFATKRQKDLCRTILECSDTEFATLKLGGLKVQSFYRNIAGYQYSSSVTVDRHAMRSVDFNKSLTPKQYGIIEDAHIEVASMFEILPHQLQAVVWLQVRNAA